MKLSDKMGETTRLEVLRIKLESLNSALVCLQLMEGDRKSLGYCEYLGWSNLKESKLNCLKYLKYFQSFAPDVPKKGPMFISEDLLERLIVTVQAVTFIIIS